MVSEKGSIAHSAGGILFLVFHPLNESYKWVSPEMLCMHEQRSTIIHHTREKSVLATWTNNNAMVKELALPYNLTVLDLRDKGVFFLHNRIHYCGVC